MSNQDQPIAYQAGKTSKKKQTTIILILVVAVLIICFCLTGLAAVIYFDPFELGLLGRLRGGYDSITGTMPEETEIYLSIDMLKFLSEDTRGVFDAIAGSSGDPDVTNREEFIQQMDDNLMDEFGVTFSGDIQPWLGQYMGVGFFDINTNEYGEPKLDHWLFVIEARNRKAADAFILKLVGNISSDAGDPYVEREHNGMVIYETTTGNDRIAIGRKGGHVFFSSSAAHIIRAYDLKSGETLANNEGFRSATGVLPNTRIMTAFISESIFETLTGVIEQDALDSFSLPGYAQNLGLSLSLVDKGLKFDATAAYDMSSLSQSQIGHLSSPGATGSIAEQIPSSAVGFVTGNNLEKVWSYLRDSIQESTGSGPEEFNDSMDLLEDEIGLNPDTDLFPLLDQEWGLAILRERDTLITEQLDFPLGLLLVAGTSNQVQLNQNVGRIADRMSKLGLVMAKEIVAENMTYYEMQTFLFGEPILAFGVKDAQLFLATHADNLESGTEPSASLANSTAYQAAWGTITDSMDPILYLDIQQLITLLPELSSDELAVLQPVQTITLAGSPLAGSVKQWALMIYLESQ